MTKDVKLMLKGISEESGQPFSKEIHHLDEVKSCGNYIVVGRNVSTADGLPPISDKSNDYFCCEALLTVACCYDESEAQSSSAYGQTLTICDKETGKTNTYTRTISPARNNGKWSLWQMVATGKVELVGGNNDIIEMLGNVSEELAIVKGKCEQSDMMHSISTARHFNYMGNTPFSQVAIAAGVDKMVIAGYLDFEYNEAQSYSFSYINKSNNSFDLYRKRNNTNVADEGNLTHMASFTVEKSEGSPYYLATSASSPRSWLVIDWDNVKSVNGIYDYDGVALSPALFKNGGFGSRIEDVSKQAEKNGTHITSTVRWINELRDEKIDYGTSVIVNQFQKSNEVGVQLYSLSTFSGAGMYVGKLNPFRYILSYFKCSDWVATPKPITKMLLQIRENTHEGNILHNQTIDIQINPGETVPIIFDLGEVKTFTADLYVTLRADSWGTPMRPADSCYPFEPADGTTYPNFYWWSNGNVNPNFTGSISTSSKGRDFFFQTFIEMNMQTVLTDEVLGDIQKRLNLNPNIEISLPDRIVAVVGDTLQLFYRGIIQAVNPYIYDILITCPKGKHTPRYFEYTPTPEDVGIVDFSLNIKDNNGVSIATKNCKLQTVAAVKSPENNIKVLCFGASNTAGGDWVKETDRRLKATDGSPVGLGLANIEFCGKITGDGAGWFGIGGWSWKTYTSIGSPTFRFYVSGVSSLSVGSIYSHRGYSYTVREVNVTDGVGNILCETESESNTPEESGVLVKTSGSGDATIDFTSFVVDTQNPLWDSTNGKMSFIPYANDVAGGQIDVVYTLLTWNGLKSGMTADDFEPILSQMKVFADTLHAEFPDAKLKLLGQNPPSLNGGMGGNYGATGSGYADTYGMFRTILRMNDVYQHFANSEDYSRFVEFVNVSSQFDVENNMHSTEKAVNTRNALTERIDTNGVHPTFEGYMQIADVVFRNIVAEFCQ